MRIVSLLPSATEILCALGLEQHLVAISHECDYPPSVASLPRITQSILQQGMSPKEIDDAVRAANLDEQPLYSIDADKLIALEPDLIVTQGVCAVCAVAEETVHQSLSFARVETVSAATVLSLESLSLDGIEADIRKLGALSDRQVAADRICSKMKGVRNSLSDLPGEPPRVLMLEWPDPPWYGGHWVPEQVAAAGEAGGIDIICRIKGLDREGRRVRIILDEKGIVVAAEVAAVAGGAVRRVFHVAEMHEGRHQRLLLLLPAEHQPVTHSAV